MIDKKYKKVGDVPFKLPSLDLIIYASDHRRQLVILETGDAPGSINPVIMHT